MGPSFALTVPPEPLLSGAMVWDLCICPPFPKQPLCPERWVDEDVAKGSKNQKKIVEKFKDFVKESKRFWPLFVRGGILGDQPFLETKAHTDL